MHACVSSPHIKTLSSSPLAEEKTYWKKKRYPHSRHTNNKLHTHTHTHPGGTCLRGQKAQNNAAPPVLWDTLFNCTEEGGSNVSAKLWLMPKIIITHVCSLACTQSFLRLSWCQCYFSVVRRFWNILQWCTALGVQQHQFAWVCGD